MDKAYLLVGMDGMGVGEWWSRSSNGKNKPEAGEAVSSRKRERGSLTADARAQGRVCRIGVSAETRKRRGEVCVCVQVDAVS